MNFVCCTYSKTCQSCFFFSALCYELILLNSYVIQAWCLFLCVVFFFCVQCISGGFCFFLLCGRRVRGITRARHELQEGARDFAAPAIRCMYVCCIYLYVSVCPCTSPPLLRASMLTTR